MHVDLAGLDWDDDDTTIEWDHDAGCPARVAAERRAAREPAVCAACRHMLVRIAGGEAGACLDCAVVYRGRESMPIAGAVR